MKVMYFKVLRDVLYEIQNLNNWWIVLLVEVQYRCSEYQVKSYLKK